MSSDIRLIHFFLTWSSGEPPLWPGLAGAHGQTVRTSRSTELPEALVVGLEVEPDAPSVLEQRPAIRAGIRDA